MNREIIVQNLALELTRRCNLNCLHCSRGDAQDKVMSDEVIEKIFSDIQGVYNLQFVGGETSTSLDRLKKVVSVIKEKKTKLRSALIFTNAVDINDEYIATLNELKSYIKEKNQIAFEKGEFQNDFDYEHKGLTKKMTKEYPFLVVVSLDKYHLESIDKLSSRKKVKENIDKLVENFPVEIDKMCNFVIYNEGRAKNLENVYKTKVSLQEYTGLHYTNKENNESYIMVGPVIAISYDGKIIETNKDYEYCDAHAVGNINEESFYEMLKKLQKVKKFRLAKDVKTMYSIFNKIVHKSYTTTKEIRKMINYNNKKRRCYDYSYLQEETTDYKEVKEPVKKR